MLGSFFLLLSVLVGWSIVRQVPLKLRRLEGLAMSVVVGFCASAWIVFGAALILGFSLGLPIALSLLSVLALSILLIEQKATLQTKPYSKRFKIVAFIMAAGIAYILIRLILLSYQFPADGAWKSNGNAWGDAPLHVAYVTHFSLGDKISLISPSYMKVPLTYPFMADFYSSILRRLGAGWTFAMAAPSIAMVLALLYLIFSFGYRLLGSARAAWLQLLFLVFSGSLHAGYYMTRIILTKGIDAYHAAIGYSIPNATGDDYLNFFHSHIVPQRSYLFGMSLLIVTSTILLEMTRRRNPNTELKLGALSSWQKLKNQLGGHNQFKQFFNPTALSAGLFIGMLPLIHVHSLLVLIGLMGLGTIGMLIKYRALPKAWLGASLIGALLVTPQLIWQFRSTFDSHFTKWISGWMLSHFAQIQGGNLLTYWFMQLGFVLVVMVLGGLWLKRYRAASRIWLYYLAGIAIFVICNVYVFQPSIWDNMKFFEYAFWFEMLVAGYLIAIWSRQRVGRFITPIIVVSLTITGFYTLVLTGPRLNFELLSKEEVAFGESMQDTLPQNAYVLVGDRHNHPITMLSNRNVLMTFAGWYNLYDSRWPIVYSDRATMLTGGLQAENLIAKYGLTHAVFSDNEVNDGSANLDFFKSHYALIANQSGWWVFDLRSRV